MILNYPSLGSGEQRGQIREIFGFKGKTVVLAGGRQEWSSGVPGFSFDYSSCCWTFKFGHLHNCLPWAVDYSKVMKERTFPPLALTSHYLKTMHTALETKRDQPTGKEEEKNGPRSFQRTLWSPQVNKESNLIKPRGRRGMSQWTWIIVIALASRLGSFKWLNRKSKTKGSQMNKLPHQMPK